MQGHELYLFSRIYLLDNLTAMPTLKSTGIATQLTLLILIRQASLGLLAGMLKKHVQPLKRQLELVNQFCNIGRFQQSRVNKILDDFV